jgi:four helix bundle protein
MDIRQAGSRWTAFTIRPSRVMKATSIGNRMNQVWMAFVGAMTRAAPDARESRPSSPLRRLAESNAVETAWATTRPLRRLTSWYAASDFSSSGFRNTDVILTHVGPGWVTLGHVGCWVLRAMCYVPVLSARCFVLRAGAKCSVLCAKCSVLCATCRCWVLGAECRCWVPRATGTAVARRRRMGVSRYKDLEYWQLANELKLQVYALVNNSPARRDLKFRDQIFDSARSGPRNIAEGFARYHHPEFAHLLGVAKASIVETHNHIGDGYDLGYWTANERDRIEALADRAANATTGLINHLRHTRAPQASPRASGAHQRRKT